jgi:hypothetical protein
MDDKDLVKAVRALVHLFGKIESDYRKLFSFFSDQSKKFSKLKNFFQKRVDMITNLRKNTGEIDGVVSFTVVLFRLIDGYQDVEDLSDNKYLLTFTRGRHELVKSYIATSIVPKVQRCLRRLKIENGDGDGDSVESDDLLELLNDIKWELIRKELYSNGIIDDDQLERPFHDQAGNEITREVDLNQDSFERSKNLTII